MCNSNRFLSHEQKLLGVMGVWEVEKGTPKKVVLWWLDGIEELASLSNYVKSIVMRNICEGREKMVPDQTSTVASTLLLKRRAPVSFQRNARVACYVWQLEWHGRIFSWQHHKYSFLCWTIFSWQHHKYSFLLRATCAAILEPWLCVRLVQ